MKNIEANKTFCEVLSQYKNLSIFVDPCSGNNGDLLIWQGMLAQLQRHSIKPIESPASADIIIINGGGMFIDAYRQGIDKVNYYSKNFPNKPLIIAPNSFGFRKVNFKEVLAERAGKIIIFSREKYSKEYIDEISRNLTHVTSYIDHDLAFSLKDSEWIRTLKEQTIFKKGKLLVVDRMDLESPTQRLSIVRGLYSRILPKAIKDAIRKRRLKHRSERGTGFTKVALATLKHSISNPTICDIETIDISRPDICSFDQFIEKICESNYIFTNRLHVGVLGHLLGREVYLQEGSYHKLTGIYELSMTEKHTTHLLSSLNPYR